MINISHTFREKIRKIQNKLKVAKKKIKEEKEATIPPRNIYLLFKTCSILPKNAV